MNYFSSYSEPQLIKILKKYQLYKKKLADFIVLDRNIFDIAPSQIAQTKVLLTVLEGEEIYRC